MTIEEEILQWHYAQRPEARVLGRVNELVFIRRVVPGSTFSTGVIKITMHRVYVDVWSVRGCEPRRSAELTHFEAFDVSALLRGISGEVA